MEKNVINKIIQNLTPTSIVNIFNNKNRNILSLIFSIFLSCIIILGYQLEKESKILWLAKTFGKILSVAFVLYFIMTLVIFVIEEISDYKDDSKSENSKKLYVIGLVCIIFLMY